MLVVLCGRAGPAETGEPRRGSADASGNCCPQKCFCPGAVGCSGVFTPVPRTELSIPAPCCWKKLLLILNERSKAQQNNGPCISFGLEKAPLVAECIYRR